MRSNSLPQQVFCSKLLRFLLWAGCIRRSRGFGLNHQRNAVGEVSVSKRQVYKMQLEASHRCSAEGGPAVTMVEKSWLLAQCTLGSRIKSPSHPLSSTLPLFTQTQTLSLKHKRTYVPIPCMSVLQNGFKCSTLWKTLEVASTSSFLCPFPI